MKKSIIISISLTVLLFVSLQIKSQNHTLVFGIYGSETKTDSITVRNLDQGTELTIDGDDTLLLTNTSTNMSIIKSNSQILNVYPNPLTESSTIEISNPNDGNISIELYDILARKVAHFTGFMPKGVCTFRLSNLSCGSYIANVKTISNSNSVKLISKSERRGSPSIKFQGVLYQELGVKSTQSLLDNFEMDYKVGETLQITGYYNNCSSVKEIVPDNSQYLEFELLPIANIIADPTITSSDQSVRFFANDITGKPIAWDWDFGDGSTSNEKDPYHQYSSVGSYSVSLTVSNECGNATNTIEDYIQVYSIPGTYDVKTTQISTDGDTTYHSWTEEIKKVGIEEYLTQYVGHWDPPVNPNFGFRFYIVDGEIFVPTQFLADLYSNEVNGTDKGSINIVTGELYIEYSISFESGNAYYKSTYTPLE